MKIHTEGVFVFKLRSHVSKIVSSRIIKKVRPSEITVAVGVFSLFTWIKTDCGENKENGIPQTNIRTIARLNIQ